MTDLSSFFHYKQTQSYDICLLHVQNRVGKSAWRLLQFEIMSLRAIQEFVIHLQSFRNIDLWYQGAYLLRLQIYLEVDPIKNIRIYAHPFAHTQQYQGQQSLPIGDTQVIKQASIHNDSSSFLSKAFLLRYYQEEVQLNDIVHFRIETDISLEESEFILEANLLFFDQQIKKIDPEEITLEKAKNPKTKKYILKNSIRGIHQFLPLYFEGQYFSLANLNIHTICLDYRYRINQIQLFEFSRLSAVEKRKLLEKNKKIQPKQINYVESVKIMGKTDILGLLKTIQNIVILNMKKHYENLLKEYRHLFSKSITQGHRQLYNNILVHPSQLTLFEDQVENNKGDKQEEKLFKRYKSKNTNEIIQNMLNETNLISGQMLKLWHHYIDIIRVSPRFTSAYYQDRNLRLQQTFWNKLCRMSKHMITDICIAPNNIQQKHQQSEKQLQVQRQKLIFPSNVMSYDFQTRKKKLCLLLEDVYQYNHGQQSVILKQQEIITDTSLHLIVLVHGFQGNSMDMRLIKNTLSLYYPQAAFLCSSSNEQLTDGDIIQMGNRLSNEVKNHINQFFPPGALEHISFIGHSLGGLIIRAALPRLLDLKGKFHTLMTFSTPHLGYKVNASSVIEAGIWFLQKFKNSNCLRQLTLADSSNPKETCLYRISNLQGLKYFKNIFLFSSKQDSYAPYQSARIQIHPDFMGAKDPLKETHCQMVRNILREVQASRLHRMRVKFIIQETNIDSIIGRTAHILFLENSELIQMFLQTHPQLFN